MHWTLFSVIAPPNMPLCTLYHLTPTVMSHWNGIRGLTDQKERKFEVCRPNFLKI